MVSARGRSAGRNNRPATVIASAAPVSCATIKGATSGKRMPANVFENARAMVTAGFANDVEAVNQ